MHAGRSGIGHIALSSVPSIAAGALIRARASPIDAVHTQGLLAVAASPPTLAVAVVHTHTHSVLTQGKAGRNVAVPADPALLALTALALGHQRVTPKALLELLGTGNTHVLHAASPRVVHACVPLRTAAVVRSHFIVDDIGAALVDRADFGQKAAAWVVEGDRVEAVQRGLVGVQAAVEVGGAGVAVDGAVAQAVADAGGERGLGDKAGTGGAAGTVRAVRAQGVLRAVVAVAPALVGAGCGKAVRLAGVAAAIAPIVETGRIVVRRIALAVTHQVKGTARQRLVCVQVETCHVVCWERVCSA